MLGGFISGLVLIKDVNFTLQLDVIHIHHHIVFL
jgi:hypothetical protein